MLNKTEIFEKLIVQLQKERDHLVNAAKVAQESATHEESKAENKYDTRATEASYLAAGQAIRIAEIEKSIFDLKSLSETSISAIFDSIKPGALIEVSSGGRKNWFIFANRAGGEKTIFQDTTIQVLTGQSVMGQSLLGCRVGDVVEMENKKGEVIIQVLSVY